MTERADESRGSPQGRRAGKHAAGRRPVDTSSLAGRRLTRRRLLQAGLGASGLAVLAACAPASPPRESTGPAAATQGGGTTPAQSGGQLVFTTGSEPLTLNPAFGTSSDTIYFQQFLFDGLTRPDDNLRPIPSLAESWDVEPGGLSYTFHLRRGVQFHDGRELTAGDVKFTWELINHPANKAANHSRSSFSPACVMSGSLFSPPPAWHCTHCNALI